MASSAARSEQATHSNPPEPPVDRKRKRPAAPASAPTPTSAADPHTGPSPMDLIEIVRVFHLVPDTNLRMTAGADAEPSDPETSQSDPWGLPENCDSLLRDAFADAGHIYHLAREAAQAAGQGDPWVTLAMSHRDLSDASAISRAWARASAIGEQVSERQATTRLQFKTEGNLVRALRRYGYHHRAGTPISLGVIRVLELLRAEDDRRADARRKRDRRGGTTPDESGRELASGVTEFRSRNELEDRILHAITEVENRVKPDSPEIRSETD